MSARPYYKTKPLLVNGSHNLLFAPRSEINFSETLQNLKYYLFQVLMDIRNERSYPTPIANSTLLPLLLLSLTRQRHTPTTATGFQKEYDYIVVGAGSAGSVIANRLSELPCVSVLLLEAGSHPPVISEVPGFSRSFWFTDIDWQYRTVPQKHTGNGLINREVVWPSGKSLGGSSSLNSMVYSRGSRRDYDDWAAQGAKGWSFDDILPYFKKLEDIKDAEYRNEDDYGVGGPVTVEKPNYQAEIKASVFKAAMQMGFEIIEPNGQKQIGFYDQLATIRRGQRCSTAKAYLLPAENRTNLAILPKAFVRKILIQRHRATAILFDYEGFTYHVKARKEIILSAGAINSAQLLMLSGIGPKEELRKFGIPLVADLPVGKNFHDHCGIALSFRLSSNIQKLSEKFTDLANIATYIQNKTGILASSDGISAVAFLNNLTNTIAEDLPIYQLYFSEGTSKIPKEQYGLKPEVYSQVFGPYENDSLLSCEIHVLQPRSRGSVRLRSANPYDPPLIDPNYLEDPKDVEDLVQGMKMCQKIATSEPLRRLGSKPFQTSYPGCEMYRSDIDLYFRCLAKSFVLSTSHPAGSVKMGDPEDASTVVSSELRVKGVTGLRVVDASVMPKLPSGNTNIPVIMLAEKASDMIKNTVHCPVYNNHEKGALQLSQFSFYRIWDLAMQQEDKEFPEMDLAAERAYPTPFVNSTLLPMLLLSLMKQRHTPKTATSINSEYDYVIVGAGAAGSVLANRLSEIPCVSVLLLEAGKSPPLLTEIPATERAFWFTDIDRNYRTVPQRNTGNGLNNREILWPSGKTVGGSTVLTDVLYSRGNPKNYDDWAKLGAVGWSYEEVLPYFKKLEDNRDPEYVANVRKFYKNAWSHFSTHHHRGKQKAEMKCNRFQRSDSDINEFCKFFKVKSNFQDLKAKEFFLFFFFFFFFFFQIIIKNRRATGVEFDFSGTTYEVRAKREVIVSAGTVRSTSKLLMLSGIGPRKELERFKIPVISDLPVGENLQDHVGTNVNFLLNPEIPQILVKLTNPVNIERYIQSRTGPLSGTAIVNTMAFLSNETNHWEKKKDFPRYQLYFVEGATLIPLLNFNLRPEVFQSVYGPYEGKPWLGCLSHLLQPRSRGTIRLRSTDPYDSPFIDPNYFDDPQDIQDVVDGLKTCMRIGTSQPLKKVGSTPSDGIYPGCEKYVLNIDRYFWCQVRSAVVSFYHPVGTAKMGDPKDPTTVVDPHLRVKNVKGLRVVDASVMPIIPSGNIEAPTLMVAEKASDIIKSTIQCKKHDYEDNSWNEPEHSSWTNGEHETEYAKPPVNTYYEPKKETWNNIPAYNERENNHPSDILSPDKIIENGQSPTVAQFPKIISPWNSPAIVPWNKNLPSWLAKLIQQ
ncbi:LOW QUALITY PROTEIN: uncharacterized protein LOC118197557 [Stegodyphus dumicola]|uniref:LOW QUALITY PROTEIN: uncharacterized protein LOC118197557 n=1 Tax=Stegodyphus dumicola TaxID=202533 RepID=UPI0015AE3A90|nr:LOW QUALITY PROTEIN: uncharacterized protein LOC118197557 [Stegodyphus dumicola]